MTQACVTQCGQDEQGGQGEQGGQDGQGGQGEQGGQGKQVGSKDLAWVMLMPVIVRNCEEFILVR